VSHRIRILNLGLCCGAIAATVSSLPPSGQLHVRITTRDGVHLDTNIFRPRAPSRVGTVLFRTPYGKGDGLPPGYSQFIDHGFAVVTQDVRGRSASEGVFDSLNHEGQDGYDTIEWIARQPWSNGRVGMAGGSYRGIVQWKAAVLDNPHLKAICPVVAGWNDYTDRFYSRGGALKLEHRLVWLSENLAAPGFRPPPLASFISHLPLRTIDRVSTGRTIGFYQSVLNHPTYDSFWKNLSVSDRIDRVNAAAFIAGGWYDNYVESDLDAFSALQRKGTPARIVIGPWAHNMSSHFRGINFGEQAWAPIRSYQAAWFDQWLNATPTKAATPAPVRIFVMGANQWRDEQEWPLKRTCYRPLYLSGGGHANSAAGDGQLVWNGAASSSFDRFLYDPRAPVPTTGGALCCDPSVLPWGPMDQSAIERRPDVLIYTSEPLRSDLEVTGTVRAALWVSTDAPDTDFTAKLVDVSADGTTRNVMDGILRLRYREGLEKVELARPGAVYPISIDVGVTSYIFPPRHRLRLEISGSNFPRFDRNPNTGRPIADETMLRPARDTVLHGPRYPSHLLLPVIGGAGNACPSDMANRR
jgi:predicted acyl esterase